MHAQVASSRLPAAHGRVVPSSKVAVAPSSAATQSVIRGFNSLVSNGFLRKSITEEKEKRKEKKKQITKNLYPFKIGFTIFDLIKKNKN